MNKRFYHYNGNTDYLGNPQRAVYKRVSRWKKIYSNGKGEPYFNHNGKRHKLNNYLKIDYYSGLLTDDNDNEIILTGYNATEYYHTTHIEIDEYSEFVRCYEFIEWETIEKLGGASDVI